MGVNRWVTGTLSTATALAVVAVGFTGAFAQDQQPPVDGSNPDELIERLDALELQLPSEVPPQGVALDDGDTWGTLTGDAGSVSAILETLEPELRQLFVDADEADGEVADAVAEVSRGWLDVWQGATALAVWEGHDLSFPVGTFEDDLATGADDLRGVAEIGLDLILDGRARQLDGYTALETLAVAEAPTQARFDERAASAATFQSEVRPELVAMLSEEPTAEVVVTNRFETDAPGVGPRATSMSVTCVDRDALEELGGVATAEVLAQLEDVSQRADCPERPDEL